MMAFLSRLMGGGLSTPVLIGLIVLLGHQLWEARDARLQNQGKVTCNLTWQIAVAKQRERKALRERDLAQDTISAERKANEELANDLSKTRIEMAELTAAASGDPRCLSERVLDTLRGRLGME